MAYDELTHVNRYLAVNKHNKKNGYMRINELDVFDPCGKECKDG